MRRILFSVVAVFVSALFARKQDIRLKLERGKVYRNKIVTHFSAKQKVMGLEIDMTEDNTFDLEFKVTDVSGELYTLEMKYIRIEMEIGFGPVQKKHISSETTSSEGLEGVLKELKANPFKVKLNSKGEIEEVEEPDAYWDKIFGRVNSVNNVLKTQLRGNVGPSAFRVRFGMLFSMYPEKSVRMGDKWEHDFSYFAVTEQVAKSVYEFKGADASFYNISGKSAIDSAGERNRTLKGDIVSDFSLDRNSGWIKYGNMEWQLSGIVSVEQAEQMNVDVEFDMKRTIRVHAD